MGENILSISVIETIKGKDNCVGFSIITNKQEIKVLISKDRVCCENWDIYICFDYNEYSPYKCYSPAMNIEIMEKLLKGKTIVEIRWGREEEEEIKKTVIDYDLGNFGVGLIISLKDEKSVYIIGNNQIKGYCTLDGTYPHYMYAEFNGRIETKRIPEDVL